MVKIHKGEIMKTKLKEKPSFYNRIIDAKKVSEILGISRSTVYKMVARNEIAYFEFSDAIRFYEQDIYDYLKKHRREPKKLRKDPL